MTTSQPWWTTESFHREQPLVEDFTSLAGPKGLALVQVYGDGRTQQGWGLTGPNGAEGFMPRYNRGEFNHRRAMHAYAHKDTPFAFIMRSVRAVCVDIDGKNGGLETLKRLGLLPPTLAETSKSGNGLHLFYSTDEDWDATTGYGLYSDHIGIEQGVDIRATGCVYHYHSQRWNNRQMTPLPEYLQQMFAARKNKHTNQTARITKVMASHDEMEILLMQDQLLAELAKPIPAGKRNNTLFAIGSQLMEAQVTAWEDAIAARGTQLGLDSDEIDKLISNIEKYAPAQP